MLLALTPFLTSIFTGGAVKESVRARESLVKDADEVVLHGGFVFHVKTKLTVHSLQLIVYFIHKAMLFYSERHK